MLLGAGLPKVLWGEATNTGAYLINKSPSSALEYKTPMEVWSGSPTNYSNLRVFGTLAYAHVKKDKLEAQNYMREKKQLPYINESKRRVNAHGRQRGRC